MKTVSLIICLVCSSVSVFPQYPENVSNYIIVSNTIPLDYNITQEEHNVLHIINNLSGKSITLDSENKFNAFFVDYFEDNAYLKPDFLQYAKSNFSLTMPLIYVRKTCNDEYLDVYLDINCVTTDKKFKKIIQFLHEKLPNSEYHISKLKNNKNEHNKLTIESVSLNTNRLTVSVKNNTPDTLKLCSSNVFVGFEENKFHLSEDYLSRTGLFLKNIDLNKAFPLGNLNHFSQCDVSISPYETVNVFGHIPDHELKQQLKGSLQLYYIEEKCDSSDDPFQQLTNCKRKTYPSNIVSIEIEKNNTIKPMQPSINRRKKKFYD